MIWPHLTYQKGLAQRSLKYELRNKHYMELWEFLPIRFSMEPLYRWAFSHNPTSLGGDFRTWPSLDFESLFPIRGFHKSGVDLLKFLWTFGGFEGGWTCDLTLSLIRLICLFDGDWPRCSRTVVTWYCPESQWSGSRSGKQFTWFSRWRR